MAQFSRPTPPTTVNTGWFGIPGSSLTGNMDDVLPDDGASYNHATVSSGSTRKVDYAMTSVTNPNITTGHKLVIRGRINFSLSASPTTRLSVVVKAAGNNILLLGAYTFNFGGSTNSGNWLTQTILLSSGHIANLQFWDSTYSNLTIEMTAGNNSLSGTANIQVTQVYIEVPEVVIIPPYEFDHIATGGLSMGGGAVVGDVTNDITKEVEGGVTFGGTALVETNFIINDLYDTPYVVTIENVGREQLGSLTDLSGANWVRASNSFSTLTITNAIDAFDTDPDFALAVFPNILVVRDRQGTVLDRMAIAKVTENDTETGATRTIQAFGMMWLLSKTYIPDYTTNGNTSVFLIVKKLLEDFQITDSPHPVKLGKIDIGISDQVKNIIVNNVSITELLQSMVKTTGGSIEVDGNSTLNWRSSVVDAESNLIISANTNLINMNIIEHHDLVRTRVVMRGDDEDGNEITATAQLLISDPIYITYGDVPEFIYDNSVKTTENLQELADSWLLRLSKLPTDISANVIDRKSVQENLTQMISHETFRIFDTVELVHPRRGSLGSKIVSKIVVKLDDPGRMSLSFIDPAVSSFVSTTKDMLSSISTNVISIKNIGVK